MTNVVSIEPARITPAAQALADAFAHDPVFRWMARDRDDLDSRLHYCFESMLRVEVRKPDPLLFMSDDGGSASIWHHVDDWRATPMQTLRVLPGFARSFGPRLDRAIRIQSTLEREHPVEPHYHLAFIGTRSSDQGRGLGGAVLREMTERCDAEATAAYLESSNPQNESLYVRHGFVATGKIRVPKGAPPMTAMWRAAR